MDTKSQQEDILVMQNCMQLTTVKTSWKKVFIATTGGFVQT